MIRPGSILLFLLLSGSFTIFSAAQDVAAVMQQAAALEKAFRDEEALQKYLQVVKADPENIDAVCRISELYNILGKRQATKEKQKDYYRKGKQFAEKAIRINPNHSEANFVMAISMGRMALMSSGEEKVKAVKDIKVYADRSIRSDPRNFKGYHVLGKWHYEISNLSSIEKWLVKVTFGALPPSSLGDAARNYQKSLELNPSFLLNYLELAKVYKKKGETARAKSLLNQLLKLPPVGSDDPKIKQLGKELLDDL